MKKKNDYIINYACEGEQYSYTVTGSKELQNQIKWLHSIGASEISIYKCGKHFEEDCDDVTEAYKQYWK